MASGPEPPPTEFENPKLLKFLAAVGGICVIQQMIPAKKEPTHHVTHPNADAYRLVKTPSNATATTAATTAAPPAAVPSTPSTEEVLSAAAEVLDAAAEVLDASSPAAAELAEPAEPTAPSIPLPDKCTLIGRTAGWSVFLEGGALFAAPPQGAPLRVSPAGVGVGAVLIGNGELLAELDGYSPGEPSLHRVTLPEAAGAIDSLPDPVPDTAPPADAAGTVMAWVTTSAPLCARGALLRLAGGEQALYLRDVEPARLGTAAWLATCRRLKLPDPPIDANGPPIYSAWKQVATWDEGANVSVVGYVDGCTWVIDRTDELSIAFEPGGSRKEIPLSRSHSLRR